MLASFWIALYFADVMALDASTTFQFTTFGITMTDAKTHEVGTTLALINKLA
jgi:hypothetical protein